jgi:hypothetical protein
MPQHEKIDTTKPKAARSEAAQNVSTELPRIVIPSLMSRVVPSAFQTLAENSLMQGEDTLATLGAAAEETYSVSVRNLDEYGLKILKAGRSNVHAAFDCCRELAAAKSQADMMEAWAAHARRQFDAILTQNREIWSLAWWRPMPHGRS